LPSLIELFKKHKRQHELLSFFQTALQENPENAELDKALEQIYRECGQQDKARAMYEPVVSH